MGSLYTLTDLRLCGRPSCLFDLSGRAPMNSTHAIDSTRQQTRGAADYLQQTEVPKEPVRTSHLYGLPCARCGAYYFSDEPNCPVCQSRSVNGPARTGASESLTTHERLYGLPCPKCGAYYFSDEPNCPVCESRRLAAVRCNSEYEDVEAPRA